MADRSQMYQSPASQAEIEPPNGACTDFRAHKITENFPMPA